MGFLSFLRGWKSSRSDRSLSSSAAAGTVLLPAKIWHHTLTQITILTHPLGASPGTDLDRPLIINALYSITAAASLNDQEEQLETSPFYALSRAISAQSAAEGIPAEELNLVGFAFDPEHGYAARVSAHSRKYTALFGAPAPVARATTPFHNEITAVIAAGISDENENVRTYVLAVDGIAYAALILSSELR